MRSEDFTFKHSGMGSIVPHKAIEDMEKVTEMIAKEQPFRSPFEIIPSAVNCRCGINLNSFSSAIDDFLEKLIGEYKMKPEIKKVIFNNPATIILWKDGTKTVVKCQKGDTFDKEKGFVLAYLKKLLGNDNTFNKVIRKWVQTNENESDA